MSHQWSHMYNTLYGTTVPQHLQASPAGPPQHYPNGVMHPPAVPTAPHHIMHPPAAPTATRNMAPAPAVPRPTRQRVNTGPPPAVTLAMQQAINHFHEVQATQGSSRTNMATIRVLADHIDRVSATSQQVLLERISKQDAILVKQQESIDSLVKLYSEGRHESMKEQEKLRVEVADIGRMTERLTKGINDAMKLLASGTIKAITECQTKLERRLFCVEESCEGLKEEVRDPQARLDTPVRHEVAIGSDLPIREVSYCDASTTTPIPEALSSPQPVDVKPSFPSPPIVQEEDELVSTHSNLFSPDSSPESTEIIEHEVEELVLIRSELFSSESGLTFTHEEDELDFTSSNLPFPGSGPTCACEEDELVSTGSNQPFSESVLGSTPASTISLPDASAVLKNHTDRVKETVSHATPPRPSASRLISRAESMSPLSSLPSDDPPLTPMKKLSAPTPTSRGRGFSGAAAGLSRTPKWQHASPEPTDVKVAKRPRNISPFKISKKLKKELIDEDSAYETPIRTKRSTAPSTLGSSWPKLTATKNAKSRLFIQCDKCDLWYHWGCVGIRDNDARLRDDEVFECPPCKGCRDKAIYPSPTKEGQSEACSRADCDIDDSTDTEYFVEKIIGRFDSKIAGVRRFSWLVKWEGYPAEEATWTPETEIVDPAKLIEDFYLAAEAEVISLSQCTLALLKEAVVAGWATRRD